MAWRLRGVKSGYRLYYNAKKSRYEVHDVEQKCDTLAFVSPFGELDCRLVDYAAYSGVQNAEKIFADIERNNGLISKNAARRNLEKQMEIYEQRRFYEGN